MTYQIRQYSSYIIAYVITFLLVLPVCFKDNAYSPYSKWLGYQTTPSARLDLYKAANDIQYHRDLQYLANLPALEHHKLHHWESTNAKYKVLVTIVTASRKQLGSASRDHYSPHYLTQVISRYAKLETLKQSSQLTDFKLLICDVSSNHHEEAELMSSMAELLKAKKHHRPNLNKFEVEKRDYVACLNYSLTRQADYILMVEDDGLADMKLLDRLDHLFAVRVPKLNNEFGYIKLFHPSRLNGYITPDINRLLEWLAIAGLLEHALSLSFYVSGYGCTASWEKRLIRFIYFVLLLLAIGRINILEFRSVSPHLYRLVPAPSCCVPAIVFTPTGGRQMVDYLVDVTCDKDFPKDTAMDLSHTVTGLRAWFFEPKLYSHIGVYSTRSDKVVDPKIVD